MPYFDAEDDFGEDNTAEKIIRLTDLTGSIENESDSDVENKSPDAHPKNTLTIHARDKVSDKTVSLSHTDNNSNATTFDAPETQMMLESTVGVGIVAFSGRDDVSATGDVSGVTKQLTPSDISIQLSDKDDSICLGQGVRQISTIISSGSSSINEPLQVSLPSSIPDTETETSSGSTDGQQKSFIKDFTDPSQTVVSMPDSSPSWNSSGMDPFRLSLSGIPATGPLTQQPRFPSHLSPSDNTLSFPSLRLSPLEGPSLQPSMHCSFDKTEAAPKESSVLPLIEKESAAFQVPSCVKSDAIQLSLPCISNYDDESLHHAEKRGEDLSREPEHGKNNQEDPTAVDKHADITTKPVDVAPVREDPIANAIPPPPYNRRHNFHILTKFETRKRTASAPNYRFAIEVQHGGYGVVASSQTPARPTHSNIVPSSQTPVSRGRIGDASDMSPSIRKFQTNGLLPSAMFARQHGFVVPEPDLTARRHSWDPSIRLPKRKAIIHKKEDQRKRIRMTVVPETNLPKPIVCRGVKLVPSTNLLGKRRKQSPDPTVSKGALLSGKEILMRGRPDSPYEAEQAARQQISPTSKKETTTNNSFTTEIPVERPQSPELVQFEQVLCDHSSW
jgi:hypothetical protein